MKTKIERRMRTEKQSAETEVLGTSRAARPSTDASDQLASLESEAITIMREAAGAYTKAAILFSGGKDSA
ncbi:MAG: hypothetical protein ACK5TP_04110, partial [bacterium]